MCYRENDIGIKDQMQCHYCSSRVLEKRRPNKVLIIPAK